MNRTLVIPITLLFAPACIAIHGVDGEQQSESQTLEFDEPVESIVFDVGSGDFQVTRTDGQTARLERTVRWRGDAPTVRADLAGGVLSIDVDCSGLWSCSADHTLVLPASARITGETGAGDVYIDGMDDDSIDVHTGSGNISIYDSAGPLYASAGSGDLDIECIGDDANLETGSGNIDARCVSGDLFADTSSGDIYLETIQGNIDLNTGSGTVRGTELGAATGLVTSGSGDVELEFWEPPVLADVSTGSGNATLRVPAGTYNIFLSTGSGSETMNGVTHDSRSEYALRITTGSGNARVFGE